MTQDALHGLDESELAHVVGLVENGDPAVREVELALVDQVLDATGCADDDVDALLQRAHLAALGHATVDLRGEEADAAGDRLDRAVDLQRELARRSEDDRAGLAAEFAALARLRLQHTLDERSTERDGLSRAGATAGEDIATLEHCRDAGSLDRERRRRAHAGEGLDDVGSETEVAEGHTVDLDGRHGLRLEALVHDVVGRLELLGGGRTRCGVPVVAAGALVARRPSTGVRRQRAGTIGAVRATGRGTRTLVAATLDRTLSAVTVEGTTRTVGVVGALRTLGTATVITARACATVVATRTVVTVEAGTLGCCAVEARTLGAVARAGRAVVAVEALATAIVAEATRTLVTAVVATRTSAVAVIAIAEALALRAGTAVVTARTLVTLAAALIAVRAGTGRTLSAAVIAARTVEARGGAVVVARTVVTAVRCLTATRLGTVADAARLVATRTLLRRPALLGCGALFGRAVAAVADAAAAGTTVVSGRGSAPLTGIRTSTACITRIAGVARAVTATVVAVVERRLVRAVTRLEVGRGRPPRGFLFLGMRVSF